MKTEIVCIIDRSGSMGAIRDDAIGGFNSFLDAQKKVPGEATISLVLFDHEYQEKYSGVDIQVAEPLNTTTYVPRGTTALLDAIGRTINAVGQRLHNTQEKDRPDKVIVVILTDGQENCSTEFTRKKIFDMISLQRSVYSWEFIFLAAGQDAVQEGGLMGFSANDSYNFAATPAGVRSAFGSMCTATTLYRTEVGTAHVIKRGIKNDPI